MGTQTRLVSGLTWETGGMCERPRVPPALPLPTAGCGHPGPLGINLWGPE